MCTIHYLLVDFWDTLLDPNFYVGLASLAIVFLIPFLTTKRKKVFLERVCEAELSSSEKTGSKNGNNPVRKLLVIDIQNFVGRLAGGLGGVNITKDKYEKPISIMFGKKSRILGAEVLEESPADIGARIRTNRASAAGELELEPILLNQGDWIRIKVIVEDPQEERCSRLMKPEVMKTTIKFRGRIEGIKGISARWDSIDLAKYGFISLIASILLSAPLSWAAVLVEGSIRQAVQSPLFAFSMGVDLFFVALATFLIVQATIKKKKGLRLVQTIDVAEENLEIIPGHYT